MIYLAETVKTWTTWKEPTMDKLKELGNRAFAIPFAIALLIFCVLGLAIAPMLHMSPKNMPVAVVNLDEGAELPTGETFVAGDQIVDNIDELVSENSDEGDAPIKFTVLKSREELDASIDEYYGALVIPADFTERQMAGNTALASTLGEGIQELMAGSAAGAPDGAAAAAAAQANPEAAAQAQQQAQAQMAAKMQGIILDAVTAQQDADKPKIELVVNTVKSPVFANTLQSSVATMLAQRGVEVEVTSIGNAAEDANPISGMMGVQMMVMPLFIMSLIMSLIAMIVTWLPAQAEGRQGKTHAAGKQVGFTIVASLVAATLAYGIVAWIGGIEVPATAILFLWLASACIMLANIGLLDLALPLGVLVMICTFALGMGTAVLPPEMLPDFWANWVVPWAPQAAIGDGIRNIMYLDGGAFDVGVTRLLAWGCVGIVALIAAVFAPSRKQGN